MENLKMNKSVKDIKALALLSFFFILFLPSFAHASVNFSGVETREIRDTSAIILWHAEVSGSIPAPLTGQVEYGPTTSYGSQTDIDSNSFFHSISLTSLTPGTIYHYRLRAKNSQDVETISDDYTFTTLTDAIAQNITGISPNASGNTIINDDTTWQGVTATCGGNITVGNATKRINFTIKDSTITIVGTWTMGGDTPVDFNLINSTIIFDVQSGVPTLQPNGIMRSTNALVVESTRILSNPSRIVFQDSTVRGVDYSHVSRGVVLNTGGYWGANINYPQAKHTFIADNVTFAYMGGLESTTGAGYNAFNSGVELASDSKLVNIKIDHCGRGFSVSTKPLLLDYINSEGGYLSFNGGMNWTHLTMHKTVEGLYSPAFGGTVANGWFDANQTKFNIMSSSDVVFENNTVMMAAFNAGDGQYDWNGNNNTLRNNIFIDTGVGSRKDKLNVINNSFTRGMPSGGNIPINAGGTNFTINGNSITGGSPGIYLIPWAYRDHNDTTKIGGHTINNNIIDASGVGIAINYQTNNTFIGNRILNSYIYQGIQLNNSDNQLFRDTYISNSKTDDIYIGNNCSNIKFINTFFNASKIGLGSSALFSPYSYLDTRILDQSGNPISSATITVTNEIDNTNYSSINIDGSNKSTFTTDSQGYTPLPSDTANSIAILDYAKSSTTQTEMTYTVTATKNGRTTTVTGINPDATWYRITPDTHQNTVTLTLDMTAPTYTLTINQGTGSGSYAQNQTVTITANSSPSGQTFDRWTGDTQYLSSTTLSTATVTMPTQPISLTATYKNIVTGGTGGTGDSGGGTTPLIPVIIKTEITSITNNQVSLSLNVTNATQMILSDNSSFTGSTWQTYTVSPTYTKTDAQTKLYLKFKSSTDNISSIVELTIPSDTTTPNDGNTPDNNTGNNTTSPYPTGTLLKLPDSFKVYVIIDNKKKWISTPEVFEQLGYKWTEIKILTPTELNNIPDYEDNLIRAINDYKVYLVVNGVKRHIPNPIIFLDYGFKWNEVKDVPQTTIDKYKPTYLIKQSGSNGIYYVNPQEIRKLIPNTGVFNSYNDKTEDIQIISKTEMDFYPLSNLIKLNGTNDIYLIEGNIKKRIPNPQVFNKYKLNWNLVMSVNQTEFNFYSDGGELK